MCEYDSPPLGGERVGGGGRAPGSAPCRVQPGTPLIPTGRKTDSSGRSAGWYRARGWWGGRALRVGAAEQRIAGLPAHPEARAPRRHRQFARAGFGADTRLRVRHPTVLPTHGKAPFAGYKNCHPCVRSVGSGMSPVRTLHAPATGGGNGGRSIACPSIPLPPARPGIADRALDDYRPGSTGQPSRYRRRAHPSREPRPVAPARSATSRKAARRCPRAP